MHTAVVTGDSHQGSRLFLVTLSLLAAATFWSTALVEILAGACLLTGIVVTLKVFRSDRDAVHPPLLFRLLLVLWCLYLVLVVVSFFVSRVPNLGPDRLAGFWHALMFPLLLIVPFDIDRIAQPLRVFGTSAAVASLAAIVRFALEHPRELQALFIGDTTFDCLVSVAAILATGHLAYLLKKPGNRARSKLVIAIVGLSACLTAIGFSTRKGPILAAGIGGMILLLLADRRFAIGFAGLAGLILLVAPPLLHQKIVWFFTGRPIERYDLWRAGFSLLNDLPLFGYGPGSYRAILPAGVPVSTHVASWHNDFLQTILESGWLAGALYAALVGAILLTTIRWAVSPVAPTERIVRLTVLLVLGVQVAFSFTNAIVSSPALGTVWWGTLAIVLRCSQTFPTERQTP